MTNHPDARPDFRARIVHPGAWWIWAICLAIAISTTTNPVLLVLVDVILLVTALARRPYAPWAHNLRMYLGLSAFIIASRLLLHVLVGFKTNDVVLNLPSVHLPSWAAGITLLGPLGLGGLIGAGLEGLRLATMLMCFGVANGLANPRRLLAATPAAVRDIGTASAIALSLSPQLVESAQRVRAAQVLRGSSQHRIRRVALPVLHDTLDRSLSLAASMEARGYGRRSSLTGGARVWATSVSLLGAFLTCIGLYGTMQGRGVGGVVQGAPGWTTLPVLVAGLVMAAVGVALTGRMMRRTRYRRDPWGAMEWAVSLCGLGALVGVRWVFSQYPTAISTPLEPLGMPQIPWLLPIVVLPAVLPAFFTPVPVRAMRQTPPRRRPHHEERPDPMMLRGAHD